MSSDEKNLSMNKVILKELRISSQEQMLFNCMDVFYSIAENAKSFWEIINGPVSIRLIDYYVTNYSKKNRVSYSIKDGDMTIIFNVYSSYKSQLKAWNKKDFDPFSRGDRIAFFVGDTCIITTIGQLNFFKWYISNKSNEYVLKNYEKIESEMNKSKKKIKKDSIIVKPKKMIKDTKISKNYNITPISLSAPKKITKIEVTFD